MANIKNNNKVHIQEAWFSGHGGTKEQSPDNKVYEYLWCFPVATFIFKTRLLSSTDQNYNNILGTVKVRLALAFNQKHGHVQCCLQSLYYFKIWTAKNHMVASLIYFLNSHKTNGTGETVLLSKRESYHKKCIMNDETSYMEIFKYKGVCEICVTLSLCTLEKWLGYREDQ